MEEKTEIEKEFAHYVSECLNPFEEIDAKKILKERCMQNLESSEPLDGDEDVAIKTVTMDIAKPIPLLEDINYTKPDSTRNTEMLCVKEYYRIRRNEYIRLQSLYSYEFRYLLCSYKFRKREYLLNKKSDHDSYGPIKNSKWKSKEEYEKYRELKLLNYYNKVTTGQEAVLFKNAMEKRQKATLLLNKKKKSRFSSRCKFSEMGVRCTEKLLSPSRFCFKHILSDTEQCLFRACSVVQSNNICHEPIVNLGSNCTCVLHEKIPMLRD